MKTVQQYLLGHQAFSTEEFILIVYADEWNAETELIGPTELVEPEQNEDVQTLQPELFVTYEVEDKANPATSAK